MVRVSLRRCDVAASLVDGSKGKKSPEEDRGERGGLLRPAATERSERRIGYRLGMSEIGLVTGCLVEQSIRLDHAALVVAPLGSIDGAAAGDVIAVETVGVVQALLDPAHHPLSPAQVRSSSSEAGQSEGDG